MLMSYSTQSHGEAVVAKISIMHPAIMLWDFLAGGSRQSIIISNSSTTGTEYRKLFLNPKTFRTN